MTFDRVFHRILCPHNTRANRPAGGRCSTFEVSLSPSGGFARRYYR